LLIGNIDLKNGRVEVKHGVIGGAKGGKGRRCTRVRPPHTAWHYLVDWNDANAPGSRRQLIKDIAERAGIKDAYLHKFRYTFAITHLRSGGDFLPCSLCMDTTHWKWCATTPRSPRSILPRHITKPARRIIGGCKILISSQITNAPDQPNPRLQFL
jgi:hypothetical protein